LNGGGADTKSTKDASVILTAGFTWSNSLTIM